VRRGGGGRLLGLLHKPYQIGTLLQLVDEAARHPPDLEVQIIN
jgi:hypothetical protein